MPVSPNHDPDCLFCKIVQGDIPAVKVFEDQQTIAFMDIFPVSEGHALVIGKEHYQNLLDIDPESLTAVMLATQRLAVAINDSLQPDGMRMVQFNGAAAGQTVFHFHVHIRPAYQNQDSSRSHGVTQADPAELEIVAGKIRSALT